MNCNVEHYHAQTGLAVTALDDQPAVVWGDGTETGRKIVSAADLGPFGKKRFGIPVDVSGKKWLRFAVWDVATNGALTQPVDLQN